MSNAFDLDDYLICLETDCGYFRLLKTASKRLADCGYVIFDYVGFDLELIILESYEGYKITAIVAKAFKGSKIQKLIMPNTIILIGNEAFANCLNLSEIVLSSKLELIPDNAFENCIKLKNLTILLSVKEIGETAFKNWYNIEERFNMLRKKDYY